MTRTPNKDGGELIDFSVWLSSRQGISSATSLHTMRELIVLLSAGTAGGGGSRGNAVYVFFAEIQAKFAVSHGKSMPTRHLSRGSIDYIFKVPDSIAFAAKINWLPGSCSGQ